MRIEADIPDHGAIVMALFEGFVQASMLELQAGAVPPYPPPEVRYQREPSGVERWKLPHQVLHDRQGDCEDLCFWFAAGMRATGDDPGAWVALTETSRTADAGDLHAVVVRSDGSIFDPSLLMLAEQGRQTRQQRRRPRRVGTVVVDGVAITDHRTGQRQESGLPPAAAPPGGAPPPARGKPVNLEELLRSSGRGRGGVYQQQAEQAMRGLRAVAQQARAMVTSSAGQSAVQAIHDAIAAGRKPGTFGRGQQRVVTDPASEGFELVQDDTGGVPVPYWYRPSELDIQAWDAGVSKDELLQQMADYESYQQQWGPWGFEGGYPQYDVWGGYPFGFDPSYAGGVAPPPEAFWGAFGQLFGGDQFDSAIDWAGLGEQESSPESLGIDSDSVIDVDDEEEAA